MRSKHFFPLVFLSLMITALFFTVSCKKEYSGGPPTYINYLTDSTWHYERYDEDDNIDGTIDYTQPAPACKSAATYTFQSNNLVIYTPSSSPCNGSDVASTCTYTFQNNGAAISWCGFNANIKLLNDTVLSVYFDDTTRQNGKLINFRGYLVYKH